VAGSKNIVMVCSQQKKWQKIKIDIHPAGKNCTELHANDLNWLR
jgi:hypothetical protein